MLASALGDNVMVVIDQSILLADASPVVSVVKNSAGQQSSASARRHVVGQCLLVQIDGLGNGFLALSPLVTVTAFYESNYRKDINWRSATVTIVKSPEHGDVSIKESDGLLKEKQAYYTPTRCYTGTDRLVLRITGPGYSLEIHYFLRVIVGDPDHPNVPDSEVLKNPDCKDLSWTIATTPSPQQPYTFGGNTLANYFLKDVSVSLNIVNLTNGAVGESTDHNITLDGDGSYGWSIDSRPYLAAYFAR